MIENIKDFFDWMGYEHPGFLLFFYALVAAILLSLFCFVFVFFPLYTVMFTISAFVIKFILIIREYMNE